MSLNRMLKVSILVSMLVMLVYLMPPILMPFFRYTNHASNMDDFNDWPYY